MDGAATMADLKESAQFALCVAIGVACILKPLLEFIAGVEPPSAALHSSVAVVTVALPLTYLAGMLLLQLLMARAPPPPRRFVCHACVMVSALLLLVAVPLTAFWLVNGGASPPPPPPS